MLFRPWTLRSISITVLLAVSGLDLPAASLGWALQPTSSTSFSRTTTTKTTRRNMSSTHTDDTDTPVKVLGVCGGIGSGKSTACKLLVESCHCLAHIDADKVAHSVYAPGSQAVQDVVAEFGTEILVRADKDGEEEYKTPMEIDRKKLGAIVFAERSAMAKLEVIVWPHVKDRLVERIQELKDSYHKTTKHSEDSANTLPVVVLEAAILLDAGWDDLLDGVWAVTVPSEHALQRLVETRGLTEAEAQKRIDAQESRRGIGSLEEELQAGNVHCVISNDKSLEDLQSTLSKSLQDPTCWRP